VNVTRISDYRHRDMTLAINDLLALAKAGRLRAFMFAIKTSSRRHAIGLTGEYWDDPTDALGVATRMEYKVNQLISAREGDPETDTMPL
jgi:hypothetical protein